MKHSTRIFMMIAGAFIGAGLLLMLLGFLAGARQSIWFDDDGLQIDDSEPTNITELNLESFHQLDVDLDYADVEILKGDQYGIDIRYYEDNCVISYTIENGVLKVSDEEKESGTRFFNIGFDFGNKSSYVKIYVPENATLDQTTIDIQDGDMDIRNLNTSSLTTTNEYGDSKFSDISAGSMDIKIENGDVDFLNIMTPTLKYSNEYGDTTFEHVSGIDNNSNMESISIDIENGDFEADNFLANNLTYSNAYGDTIIRNSNLKQIVMNVENGDLNLSGTLLGEIKISAEYGDTEIKNTEPEEAFNYSLSTEYGDITVNGKDVSQSVTKQNSSSSENSYIIQNDNGSIDVKFGE